MSGILGDHVQRLQRLTDFNALLAKANQSIATVSDEKRLLRISASWPSAMPISTWR